MSIHQVIAHFVIYSHGQIVYQGSFQVSESLNSVSFSATDGCGFSCSHSYKGTECVIDLSCTENGELIESCRLIVPINRTKRRWKQSTLGEQYEIHYRCESENWESAKLTKQKNKLR